MTESSSHFIVCHCRSCHIYKQFHNFGRTKCSYSQILKKKKKLNSITNFSLPNFKNWIRKTYVNYQLLFCWFRIEKLKEKNTTTDTGGVKLTSETNTNILNTPCKISGEHIRVKTFEILNKLRRVQGQWGYSSGLLSNKDIEFSHIG